jgi:hypothetical protein
VFKFISYRRGREKMYHAGPIEGGFVGEAMYEGLRIAGLLNGK